jgi:hypothetical protein
LSLLQSMQSSKVFNTTISATPRKRNQFVFLSWLLLVGIPYNPKIWRKFLLPNTLEFGILLEIPNPYLVSSIRNHNVRGFKVEFFIKFCICICF